MSKKIAKHDIMGKNEFDMDVVLIHKGQEIPDDLDVQEAKAVPAPAENKARGKSAGKAK